MSFRYLTLMLMIFVSTRTFAFNLFVLIETSELIENNIKSEEAVKLYHDELQKIGIKPDRDLQHDSELTEESLKM